MPSPRIALQPVLARTPLLVAVLAGLSGCQKNTATPAAPDVPVVLVRKPITREVADFEDFVGQTMAVMTIDVRARVTGYLDKVSFDDGAEVVQDALLFQIDPRPYEAEVARTKAALAQADAHNHRLEADYRRAQTLLARDQLARADYDLTAGDYAESTAMVDSYRAQYELALLNLSFTKVTAPISGRLSRRLVDPGNLVTQDTTILTSIVSQDPIYVYFDLDEGTLLKLRRLVSAGKIKSRAEAEIPVYCGLADEEGYPHRGSINFSDNRLETSTGTLRVRAVVKNPKAPSYVPALVSGGFVAWAPSANNPKPPAFSPGMYMKVHLPVGLPHQAMLVPEEAVGSDQGEKYVLVVDSEKFVRRHRLKAGNLYFQRWRAVESGLGPDDDVIVSGLQRVRPGKKVVSKPAPPTEDAPNSSMAAWPAGSTAAAPPASPPPPASPRPADASEKSNGR